MSNIFKHTSDVIQRFPVKIGYDVSGTIDAIGDSVTAFKVGDEVFCCLPWEDRGLYQRQLFLG